MSGLRHDQEAADAATHARLKPAQAFTALREQFGAAADAITDPNARYNTPHVLTVEQLRTVAVPELRSPQARDLRTAGDKIADLQRQVSELQETARLHDATLLAIALRVDELKRGQSVTIAGLEAYIRDHSDGGVLAMAEDAWGCGG